MRAAEQGPKQESIKGWNISIQTFSYSVKFDVREKQNKKKGGVYRNVILLPRSDVAKNLAHCDGWRKCVRRGEIFFCPEDMIGKGAL